MKQIGGKKKRPVVPKDPDTAEPKAAQGWGSSDAGRPTLPNGVLLGPSPITFTAMDGQPRVLKADGVVLLRWALDLSTQQWLADQAVERGIEGGAFYEADPQGRRRLNQGHRGRIVAQTTDFPARWTDLCMHSLRLAQAACPALRCDYNPTTCLLNWYDGQAEFKWHRDSENPARLQTGSSRPIVSLSVGESAEFGFKREYTDEPHETVTLESGDVLVFGAAWRLMVHSVIRILPRTKPRSLRMPAGCRLNVTFRDVDGWIDASQFPAYRVVYDIEEAPGSKPSKPIKTLARDHTRPLRTPPH